MSPLTYSSFFSSGLLSTSIPRTPRRPRQSESIDPSESGYDYSANGNAITSPSRASSPIPIPDESFIMDVDDHAHMTRRSITPTPESMSTERESTPVPSSPPHKQQSTRTLRRQRSSLSQAATSPKQAILKPPTSRLRSGSLGIYHQEANEHTSLVGRMRSGSGSSQPTSIRPRRLPSLRINRRRIPSMPIPPPNIPPPLCPLPALPLENSAVVNLTSASNPITRSHARTRGLSVSRSPLGVDENRIEESTCEAENAMKV